MFLSLNRRQVKSIDDAFYHSITRKIHKFQIRISLFAWFASVWHSFVKLNLLMFFGISSQPRQSEEQYCVMSPLWATFHCSRGRRVQRFSSAGSEIVLVWRSSFARSFNLLVLSSARNCNIVITGAMRQGSGPALSVIISRPVLARLRRRIERVI